MTNCDGCNQKIVYKQDYMAIHRKKLVYGTKKSGLVINWTDRIAGRYCMTCWLERFVISSTKDKGDRK